MKKLYSLIRACMTSDMNIFKIKRKKDNKKSGIVLVLFISLCFMFSIWTYANMFFEKMAPLHLQNIVLSIFVFFISILTIIEGIYKAGPLLFNCKDDQLLLSLPIKRSTVLFIRIFKFFFSSDENRNIVMFTQGRCCFFAVSILHILCAA